MKHENDFSKGKRGAIVAVPRGKTRITIRLDEDILRWFREKVHAAGGGSYQNLINAALRGHIGARRESLEDTQKGASRGTTEKGGAKALGVKQFQGV